MINVKTFPQCCCLDITVTYVAKASSDKVEKARKLLLPESFYLYENKVRCSGCVGCGMFHIMQFF